MDKLDPPKAMSFEGNNVSAEWKKWRRHFDFYLTATESNTKDDNVKTSILMSCIGEKGREIYETLDFPEKADENAPEPSMVLKTVMDEFEAYCSPRKNTTILRHKFFTCKQDEGQSFADFITQLKMLSQDCEFSTLKESLIKDVIICGVTDNKLRERLLREADLDLAKAIKLGQAAEETKKHVKQLKTEQEHSVYRIQKSQAIAYRREDVINNCKFCSFNHPRGKCPAYGKRCNICKRLNHFSNRCFIKRNNTDDIEVKEQRDAQSQSQGSNQRVDSLFYDEFIIDTLEINPDVNNVTSNDCLLNNSNSNINNSKVISSVEYTDDNGNYTDVDEALSKEWLLNLDINNTEVAFKLDTGAQCNVLPKHVYDKLANRPKLLANNATLSGYGDCKIDVCGRCVVSLKLKNKIHKVLFYVVKTNRIPLLGLATCTRLNLIKRVDDVDATDYKKSRIATEYADIFGEIGTLSRTYHMVLKEGVAPVISPTRRMPFAVQDKVFQELDRMEKIGVIAKIEDNEPTEWLNALVIVEKPDGKVRLCLDPRHLNKAIKREHFQLPTAESIMAKMSDAKYFSKLDASSGYWQIKVDDETSKLLSFMTPKGRYRFKRLPFGVHSASEIFQAEIAQIIVGIEGVDNSQDDIVVWGRTEKEHDERLFQVLDRIRASGLKLNLSKCIFCKPEITFLGHVISGNGIKPDPRKTTAIRDMPVPTSKEQLQRFLGMVNYLGKFIPNLATITSPLRELLQKDVVFAIEKTQIEAIEKVKEIVTSDAVLKFYDPHLPLRVRSDASSEGLGAMLQQKHDDEWHPVAYASRSLTSSERNYAAIEAETLSVVFACERFHEYLYGRSFTIQNDHKPLQAIFNKSITSCPLRIQRFFLRLQRYDFTLEYTAGTTMKVSDALSRASLKDVPEISDADMKYFVHAIISSLPISERRMNQFKAETLKDETLMKLRDYVENGWPEKKKVDKSITPYRSIRDELSSHEGILLKGNRIIVPTSMRGEIKSILHTGHMGIEKCINRAKVSVYWPNIHKEVADVVCNCSTCLTYRNALQQETLIEHDVPDVPWIKVGIDLFSLFGKEYIIIVDYHSKYTEVAPLRDETASCVINNTKKVFSRYGIPKNVFSDNGSQFTSREFKKFENQWDFSHDSSSPEYPQSNGFIERHIQTVKNVLKKSKESGDDPYLALLALNTTPDSSGHSPASRMFNRHPRTTLPSMQKPKSNKNVNNSRTKERYDERSKDLKEIKPNTTVRIFKRSKTGNWRQKGRIASKRPEPRSYNVLNEKGNIIRRNRRHLIPTNEIFEQNSSSDYDTDDESRSGHEPVENTTVTDNSVIADNEVVTQNSDYVTRYGRISRQPDRFGY